MSLLGSGPVIGLVALPTLSTTAMPPGRELLPLVSVPATSGAGAPVRNPADETFWVMKPPPLAKKSVRRVASQGVRRRRPSGERGVDDVVVGQRVADARVVQPFGPVDSWVAT